VSRCDYCGMKECCGADMGPEIERLRAERDAEFANGFRMSAEIEWLRAEMEERNRIIGMSREREARHLAEIQLLRSDLNAACALVAAAGLATGHADSAAQLVAEVLDQVADMRKEIERLKWLEKTINRAGHLSIAMEEIERLQQKRNEIIEECAEVADHYEPRCDVCPSGVAAAIRALKEARNE
jgi:hypothetical protein